MKQLLYHIPQAYFTLRSNISRKKCISQILKEFISLKKDLSIDKSFFLARQNNIDTVYAEGTLVKRW